MPYWELSELPYKTMYGILLWFLGKKSLSTVAEKDFICLQMNIQKSLHGGLIWRIL